MRIPVIMVVEDEALVRMLAVEHFEEAGYEVIEASNGDEALARLAVSARCRGGVYGLQMPGIPDGLAVAKRVREASSECAIVIASGRIRPDSIDLAAGARFIPKPYDGSKVVEIVREMIGS